MYGNDSPCRARIGTIGIGFLHLVQVVCKVYARCAVWTNGCFCFWIRLHLSIVLQNGRLSVVPIVHVFNVFIHRDIPHHCADINFEMEQRNLCYLMHIYVCDRAKILHGAEIVITSTNPSSNGIWTELQCIVIFAIVWIVFIESGCT